MYLVTADDVARIRNQLLFDGEDVSRRLSRFWLLLTLAAIIASAGVIADSTATVIGAMIVAPLMTPILGSVFSGVAADRTNLIRCLVLVVSGAAAVILIGWLMGLTVDQPVIAATNGQVAGRVSPRLIDLLAALATGAVGSIALARDDISDTLPGVAIAISLVPPLAVVGLTLEGGAPEEASGALLLFLTNVSAILAMGLLVMTIYRVSQIAQSGGATSTKAISGRRAAMVIVAALVVVSIPLAVTSARIASDRANESDVTAAAEAWAGRNGWSIISVESRPDGVAVRASGPLPEPETESLERALAAAGLGDVEVIVELIPTRSVELNVDGADS